MTKRAKFIAALVALVVLLGTVAARSWFPSAKEPGYRHVLTWGEVGERPGQFREPIGVAVAGDEVFVSDAGNSRIQVFDREGRFLREFGVKGDGRGELLRPMHMEVREEKLYVAAYLNDRIQVFSPEGKLLRTWGGPFATNIPGSANGWFKVATGVHVSPSGDIFVADFYNHRIQKFMPLIE